MQKSKHNFKDEAEGIAINEVQLILAEKRTSLAVMRTGIAVLALPMSVVSVLIATSKYYDVLHVLNLLVPLLFINLVLVVFGIYLIAQSAIRILHYDHLISEIKKTRSSIKPFL